MHQLTMAKYDPGFEHSSKAADLRQDSELIHAILNNISG
jgi:hypothetical protein